MLDAIDADKYDHFVSECPNIPTDKEPDYDVTDPASLQMLVQTIIPLTQREK